MRKIKIVPKRKHNVHNSADARIKKALKHENENLNTGKPKKGQKYIELESLMKFPVAVTKKEILGKIVVNDDRVQNGVIVSARKVDKAQDGIQVWRVTSQITDEEFVEAFSQIPAFKKKIKVMK